MERLVGEAGQPWMGWAWEHRSESQAQALPDSGREDTNLLSPPHKACPSPQFVRRSGLYPPPLSLLGQE